MSAYNQIDIFSDIIALDLGIIHPTIACAFRDEKPKSIDEALESMTKDESRRCRRKFRKILRDILSEKRIRRLSNRSKRGHVMMEVRQRAWTQVSEKHNYKLADNDE